MAQPIPIHHPSPPPLRLAVVGDIHNQWDSQDAEVLNHLGVDLVLFVGDFGNEAVALVRQIAAVDCPMAAILGNHDAWYTATPWGRKRCPYDRRQEDWVSQQLEILAQAHVGYGKRDFPGLNLSVVGGRPFSWGGPEWRYADFYGERFGISNFAQSSHRITTAAQSTDSETIIFLGHNGPSGLGDRAEDICGRDWNPLGGDFGDPDLTLAIAATKAAGKTVPLVAFGHMHHTLRHTKARQRQRLCVDGDGTIYLNAACVPRIINTATSRWRNFSLVTLQDQQVTQVNLLWMDHNLSVVSQEQLYP